MVQNSCLTGWRWTEHKAFPPWFTFPHFQKKVNVKKEKKKKKKRRCIFNSLAISTFARKYLLYGSQWSIWNKHLWNFFLPWWLKKLYPGTCLTGILSPLEAKQLLTEFWVSLEQIHVISPSGHFGFPCKKSCPCPCLTFLFFLLP